jgi:hypothetical protein
MKYQSDIFTTTFSVTVVTAIATEKNHSHSFDKKVCG